MRSTICCLCFLVLVFLAGSPQAAPKDIHAAIKAGDIALVETLLKHNPQVIKSKAKHGWSVLHSACECRDQAIIELLISKGADINALQDSRMTPLHFCGQNDNEVLAGLLVKQRAKLDLQDEKSKTALYYCAWDGSDKVARILLDAGARTDLRSKVMNKTALGAAKYRLSMYEASSGGGYMAKKISKVIDLLQKSGAKE